MVNDKLFWNAKSGDNLVEHEMRGYLTVEFKRGHILYPFREIIDSHYNVMIPPSRSWVAIPKFKPPLGEETDSDKRV